MPESNLPLRANKPLLTIGQWGAACCFSYLVLVSGAAHAASERFFPVLTESNLHWFSYFDDTYLFAEDSMHGAADEAAPSDIAKRIASYEAALEDLAVSGNNYDVVQGEILDALAQLYQQSRQWEKALETKQRRYFLARINNGLYDPGHAKTLAELAELAQAAGDVAQADSYHHALLNFQTRILEKDDPALINTYLRWADWHLHNFVTTASPALAFNSWHTGPLMNPHFLESDNFYRKALTGMRSPGYLAPEGRLAMQFAIRKWQLLHFTAFENAGPDSGFAQHDPFSSSLTPAGFMPTKIHMVRIAEEMKPPVDDSVLQDAELARHTAAQLVMLGDWMTTIGLGRDGQDRYREAEALLEASGISSDWQEKLLAPGLPVPDPDDWYHFFSQQPVFSGHIDVELTLDRNGNVSKTAFSYEGEVDPRLRKRLLRHINTLSFRPLAVGDTGEEKERPVSLRFYYE